MKFAFLKRRQAPLAHTLLSMGNSQNVSLRSLAALGKASRTRQRAPFLAKQSAAEARAKPAHVESRTAPRVPSLEDPHTAHRNPYYVPHTTQQDPLAIPRAYGHNVASIDAAAFQAAKPLGTESIDLERLNVDAMQNKNAELSDFLQELSGAITAKPAPGAVPSLEEQIVVLQFIGADQRQIDALQRKIDERDAKLALEQEKKANENPQQDINAQSRETSPQPSSANTTKKHTRIVIDAQDIMFEANITATKNAHAAYNRQSFVQQQLLDSDPFPESISAARASRSASPATTHSTGRQPTAKGGEETEQVFRHDPLQNLPSDRSSPSSIYQARSVSSNPDIIRRIKGLCTTEQMNQIVASSDPLPDDFPITNAIHLQYIRDALKVPQSIPVETDEKKYKRRLSSEL